MSAIAGLCIFLGTLLSHLHALAECWQDIVCCFVFCEAESLELIIVTLVSSVSTLLCNHMFAQELMFTCPKRSICPSPPIKV